MTRRARAAAATRWGIAAAVAVLALPAGAATEAVIEYYNPWLDHYFMTPLPGEIAVLDAGKLVGWNRTGRYFDGYASAQAAPSAVDPVCRFYIPPQHGDSHFFSASPAECAAVAAKIGTDPDYSGYIEETPAEFYIALPGTATGACAPGTLPVYRLWNGRADSNHRYTTDLATRAAMLADGYIAEGYGPLGVAMCTPGAGISDSRVRVTSTSPFSEGCDAEPATGILYAGTEVEPMIAAAPANPANLVGVFQQDRWSDGGARGLRTGYSFDGGLTWSFAQAAFSRCTGGNAANGGDYARASDPWVSIGADGVVWQSAIAFTGNTFAAGSSSAILAARSIDGGRTWSAPATLIADGSGFLNDKDSITSDPFRPGLVYVTWDRLSADGHGPSYLARTTDGGITWEPARPIYDPGPRNQTLNNQIVVARAAGAAPVAYDFFTEFDTAVNGSQSARLALVRSTDGGASWSGAIPIAAIEAIGTYDPENPARKLRDGANLGSFAAGPNGELVAVWQDARFSGGLRDGIALSRSVDGGITWSAPVGINAVPATQALLPAVTVRSDGTIGVFYYDMRNDTSDPSTLLVDAWFTASQDGVHWTETHVAGPFDFNAAPSVEGGLFIGDYQGVASVPGDFAPFYVLANPASLDPAGDDATDVYASGLRSIGTLAPQVAKSARAARPAPAAAPTAAAIVLRAESIARTLAARIHGVPGQSSSSSR
ncbi:MAG: exo-alpha-sialidase [Proteobacteria bacterium]|nr:exo-alpha-sialidase [Pseudomonadota bacterium]